METYKTGIISRHVVVQGYDVPQYALVLISNEVIWDVILCQPEKSVAEISESYTEQGWIIVNYEDYYVSPGLIDVNVKTNG
jgi:hypothetical protein